MPRADIANPDFSYDADDPDSYRAGMFRPGRELGATNTGVTIYELPPGQSICPYHYEYSEEEWLLVLNGRATVRTPAGEEAVPPNELWFFPTGRAGAHKVTNESDETIRVLMFSNVEVPAATAYPDSGKVGVFTGREDGALYVERTSGVGYYHGEPLSS